VRERSGPGGSKALKRIAVGLLLIAILLVAAVYMLNVRDEAPLAASAVTAMTSGQIARGGYLARAGNCLGCHTARGGRPYAGGRGIETPFGTVYASNLTPHARTGIGQWTPAQFWRALHNGRSRDGRLLYPAFPYPNYTHVSRDDADAIFAYLRSLPAVEQTNRPNALRFPYDSQAALALWRALYFRPGKLATDSARSGEWNRGSYLVQGLGHCNACHSSRNAFGATDGSLDLGGGLIPMRNWYAPSLTSAGEAGVADWDLGEIVALLKTGVSTHASVSGPMAEVVAGSTRFLNDADLRAIAVFLKALPPSHEAARPVAGADARTLERGAGIYERNCAECHGDVGEGVDSVYPRLAGNRAVTLEPAANVIRVVLSGGFPPGTAGNPRPYGMPPFLTALGDEDIATVVSYIRNSWGNRASAVSAYTVSRYRGHREE